MGLQSGLLGLVSLIIIIGVTFYGINQVKHLQYDYQDKLKDIASQINAAQKYQAKMDRKNDMKMDKSTELMNSIQGGFASKSALEKNIDTEKVEVSDVLKADSHATELNGNLLMTAAASRYTSKDNKNAEISNDVGINKHLMIMGNSSGGTFDRKIGILNKLDVNGGLEVDLDSSSMEVKGRDMVTVGDSSAWMRNDGYIFGKNVIDGQHVMGHVLKAGAAEFSKDGTLRASKNVRVMGDMAGGLVTGRKTVSVGASELNDLGNMKGRQLCMDNVCLLATDLKYMKTNSNPKDCLVGDWTDWGGCNKPCGGGKQYRWRNVLRPAEYDGLACPHLSEQKDCNTGVCLTNEPSFVPVDCVLSDWSAWSQCSKPCGGGMQSRTKTILQPSENAGVPCPTVAELKQEKTCNPDACPPPPVPQDCVLSPWSEYSACSAPCGGGKQSRTRSIVQIAANGGVACPPESELQFIADCNTQACVMSKLVVAINTELSLIQFKNLPSIATTGEWFVVFTTANNAGTVVRVGSTNVTKRISGSVLSGGVGYTNLNQWNSQRVFFDAAQVCKSVEFWSVNPSTGALVTVPFNSFVLSTDNFDVGIDCVLNWSTYGSCSVTCGGGTQTRTATVIKNGSGIGTACPSSLTQSAPCNTQACGTSSFAYYLNKTSRFVTFMNLPSITTTAEWYIVFSNTSGNSGTITKVGTTTVTKRVNGSYGISAGMGFTNLNQWNGQTAYFDAAYTFANVEFWSYNPSLGLVTIPLNSYTLSANNFITSFGSFSLTTLQNWGYGLYFTLDYPMEITANSVEVFGFPSSIVRFIKMLNNNATNVDLSTSTQSYYPLIRLINTSYSQIGAILAQNFAGQTSYSTLFNRTWGTPSYGGSGATKWFKFDIAVSGIGSVNDITKLAYIDSPIYANDVLNMSLGFSLPLNVLSKYYSGTWSIGNFSFAADSVSLISILNFTFATKTSITASNTILFGGFPSYTISTFMANVSGSYPFDVVTKNSIIVKCYLFDIDDVVLGSADLVTSIQGTTWGGIMNNRPLSNKSWTTTISNVKHIRFVFGMNIISQYAVTMSSISQTLTTSDLNSASITIL